MNALMHRLFGRSPDSAHIAKERLQLVLAQDRTHIPQETLELLKDELISVISKYVEIDSSHVVVSVSRASEGNRLVADIPVLGMRGTRKSKLR